MEARHIGRAIHRLDNHIKRYMELHGQRARINAITLNNAGIIGFLASHQGEDVYQKDLEAVFGITRSTASKVLCLMEEKGLIQRVSVPHDARLKKLVLTERSLLIAEEMRADGEATDRQLLRGFTEAEKQTLFDMIDRMNQNVRD